MAEALLWNRFAKLPLSEEEKGRIYAELQDAELRQLQKLLPDFLGDEAVASSLRERYLKPRPPEVPNNLSEIVANMNHHYRNISKGIHLALQPVFQKLRRSSSAARSDDTIRDEQLKKNLIQLYYVINEPVYVLRCFVTNLCLPTFELRAGHIFPVRAKEYLSDLCPDISNINDTCNGILWAEPIELAFETSSISFTWDQINHTLTPTVLDKNLLGKDMLAAAQYMRGQEGVQPQVAEEEMSHEVMNQKLKDMYTSVKSTSKTSKQKETMRNDQQEALLRLTVNLLYIKASFDEINGKVIQFPDGIQLSTRAFELAAGLAYDMAKKKGVLPVDLGYNPSVERDRDNVLLDLYFASQEVSSDDDDSYGISDLCELDFSAGPVANH